ncbi:hypothetical protein [Mesorhizobium xinjiangense]|uniref:hypothetical protein n=1 Tax=Mesorhizobium xinjiangense TaxID=2678685 RepID=UPI0012EDE179|nr:hypothetical protein [Mesorhizobium xinjiangense]
MISSVPSFGFQACVVSCLTNVHGLDRRIASRLVAAMRSHNIAQLRAMGASPEEIAQSIMAFTGGRSVDVLWRH